MRTKRYLPGKMLLLLILAAMLGSCTKEMMDNGETLPEGKYPIEFTASAYRLDVNTRGTIDNTWDGGEEVAIKIGEVTKKYIAATDGKLTPAAGVEPFCWTSTNEPIVVTAWSYIDTEGNFLETPGRATFGVASNQTTISSYEKSVFIITCQNINFSSTQGKVELAFQHLTAKVNIRITGNNIADLSSATVKVPNVTQYLLIKSIAPSSIIIDYGYSVSNILTPNVVSRSTNEITARILLAPTRLAKDRPLVQIKVDGNTYSYMCPSEIDYLDAGKEYTFNITVQGKP